MSFLSSVAGLATGQAFNPLSTYVNSEIQSHYGRKNAAYLTDLSISSARDLALNQPTWKRQGYEDAGFNPILAINDGSFAQPVSTNMPMPGAVSGDMVESGVVKPVLSSAVGAIGLLGALTNLKKDRADARAAVAEASAREAKAEYEANVWSAKNSAFYKGGVSGDGKDVQVMSEHRDNIRKGELDRESLMSERYLRETLKLILDSGQDVSGILGNLFKGGKFSAVQGMKGAIK